MNTNWENLNGGRKSFELKKRWAEIKAFCDANGEQATCQKYNLRPLTLERLLSSEPWGPSKPDFSRMDRNELLAGIAIEGVSEVRRQITELKEAWTKFTESVGEQLAIKFFLPLLQNKIELPPELDAKEDHRFDMINFPRKSAERQPDVITEAEKLLSGTPVDIDDRLDQAFKNLWNQYLSACDNGNWALALAMFQWIFEYDLMMGERAESEDFESVAKEWIAKAESLDGLTIEWISKGDICQYKPSIA